MENYLESLDGEVISLRHLIKKGRANLLLFYNTACLGCTGRAVPLAYELSLEFKDLNLIVIHSNFGKHRFSKAEILSIFTTKTSPFEIYIDPQAKVYEHYQCEGTPHWVLLDQNLDLYRSIFGSQAQAQQRLWYALESLGG